MTAKSRSGVKALNFRKPSQRWVTRITLKTHNLEITAPRPIELGKLEISLRKTFDLLRDEKLVRSVEAEGIEPRPRLRNEASTCLVWCFVSSSAGTTLFRDQAPYLIPGQRQNRETPAFFGLAAAGAQQCRDALN